VNFSMIPSVGPIVVPSDNGWLRVKVSLRETRYYVCTNSGREQKCVYHYNYNYKVTTLRVQGLSPQSTSAPEGPAEGSFKEKLVSGACEVVHYLDGVLGMAERLNLTNPQLALLREFVRWADETCSRYAHAARSTRSRRTRAEAWRGSLLYSHSDWVE
jgi:hypothetical protein